MPHGLLIVAGIDHRHGQEGAAPIAIIVHDPPDALVEAPMLSPS